MDRQPAYQKEAFNTTTDKFFWGDSSYDARSGLHPYSSIKYAELPKGNYTVSSTSNTDGI